MSDATHDRDAQEHTDDLESDEMSDAQEPATEDTEAEGAGVYEAQNFGEPGSAQSGG